MSLWSASLPTWPRHSRRRWMSQSLNSFADLLRSARKSAVHLELRDVHAVDNEDEGFRAWKSGHRLDPADRASWWRPWLDLVQEVTANGVVVRRWRARGCGRPGWWRGRPRGCGGRGGCGGRRSR
ncbi:DUF6879 family protein [Streptomyces sp. NRRL WC-3742]|uniref:DUF6879 family protein n=1 Tax=Streptomyces sp. NRRL WC-3742 TaxID=1463934 RepID=UPI002D21E285|nr:DUF6879 family protein [Streptomyces sp. NRRL WC-3742]